MTTAVFPGKFDPLTLGHLDIIQRASHLFDLLVVAIYEAPHRETLFTVAERKALIREATSELPNVQVDSFRTLMVEYARSRQAQAVIRGLRLHTDFEYEFEMALMNRKLAPEMDAVCLITSLEYQFVRSSLLKEVAQLGGDITGLAPPNVIAALLTRFDRQG